MMKSKLNMIIAIMITFCFTASLLTIIPLQAANKPYDPFLDYNHDGKISLADLVMLANSYGTSGDPALNVSVTNPPSNSLQGDINITLTWGGPGSGGFAGYNTTDKFSTGGYNRMYVSEAVVNCRDPNETFNAWFMGVNWCWGSVNNTLLNTFEFVNATSSGDYPSIWVSNSSELPVSDQTIACFDVKAAYCSLQFNAFAATGWVIIRYSIYFINE